MQRFNSFLTSYDFCHLLITFANSLDTDQPRHDVRPDLDPNCLTLMLFTKEYLERSDVEKYLQTTKKKNMKNYPACKVNVFLTKGVFCHLLITFANSLDPDQARQYVGPGLNPNCWHSDAFHERRFCKKWCWKISADDKKKSWKITQHAES